MTTSVDSFRLDFPEFADSTRFPARVIQNWISVAKSLLNSPPWDDTHETVGYKFAIASISWAAGVVTVGTSSPHGLELNSAFNLQIAGVAPGGYNGIAFCSITGASAFAYKLQDDPGVATALGTFQQVSNSVLDMGQELFAAHWIVLAARAVRASAVGGIPGEASGMTSGKGVGPLSRSYDTSAILQKDAGHWNLTVYGIQLMHFVEIMGAGPVQVGIGCDPLGAFNSSPWLGPWPFPSITGFA